MNGLRSDQSHARHARLVRLLKVGLPLMALAIMSSLFLFSRSITVDGALPYADLDVEDRLREPKITDVEIATTNAKGADIRITSKSVTPNGDRQSSARQAQGVITAPNGARTEINAPLVEYDDMTSGAALLGGVEILSGGYRMITEALDLGLSTSQAESRGPVNASGPLGQLDAGKMYLSQNDDGFLLVFKSGVRLLYVP